MTSALSVEQRGVAALPDGIPVDVSHDSNVRRPDGDMESDNDDSADALHTLRARRSGISFH